MITLVKCTPKSEPTDVGSDPKHFKAFPAEEAAFKRLYNMLYTVLN